MMEVEYELEVVEIAYKNNKNDHDVLATTRSELSSLHAIPSFDFLLHYNPIDLMYHTIHSMCANIYNVYFIKTIYFQFAFHAVVA